MITLRMAWIGGLVGLVAAGTLRADSVSLNPIRDTSISSNDFSNGMADSLFCGRTGNISVPPGTSIRVLLAFDVAGTVPAGAVITSATLTLALQQSAPGSGTRTQNIHRVLSDWGEGTSFSFQGTGAPPTMGDATWTHTFFPDEFWGHPGGDYNPVPSASQVVGIIPGEIVWGPSAQLTADVQDMLDDPSSDFGWMSIGDESELKTARRYLSRESGLPDQPVLFIEFDPPACIADLNDDNVVDAADLAMLLGNWGVNPGHPADLNGDDEVNAADLALLLGNWGPC